MNDMQWAPIGSEPLPPPLPPTQVDFTGDRSEFRKLVTKDKEWQSLKLICGSGKI